MAESPEATAYIDRLATELGDRPNLLRLAEDDLALLRGRLALVTAWIHNPAYDDTARRALAQALNLPEPR
ncbi:hypothetical protein ACIPW9_36525 [Streptomyces sp. NPDC090052]|uniref:hypothetical protein n=1 Tax=Streptomyces sp. NPDC090052 TaxID=3365931 RepID=UPI003810483E